MDRTDIGFEDARRPLDSSSTDEDLHIMMVKTQEGPLTIVTGIKPTGRPHLGNYLGTIRPALEMAQQQRAFYFIADAHALTTTRDPKRLTEMVLEVAATWEALGLDPEKIVFYRQSAVPEIFELAWLLACSTAKGLLNRGHAYKAAVDENLALHRDPDADINVGLYSYPVLMAADILAMDADLVPVGEDQQQHVEMARDIAGAFNNRYAEVFKYPKAEICDAVKTVPGLDGRKMSKSHRNEIPILCDPEELRVRVMRIKTDSRRPEEPKDPERCNVFALYRHFAPLADVSGMRDRYTCGGVAYKEVKEELHAVLMERFGAARERFADLMADPDMILGQLDEGGIKAREAAHQVLERVRQAVGTGGSLD
ncbi:MAG: tryptophan--tRNA ligase [Desulfobacteraceae bacterium]